MRIELDRVLFADGAHKEHLMALLLDARERTQHQYVISPSPGASPVNVDALVEKWTPDEDLRRLCRFVFFRRQHATTFALQPPAVTIEVTTARPETVDAAGTRAVASPSRAVELARAPLTLLLENAHNDLAFLRTVIPPGSWRGWFEDALDRRWLKPMHGGGADMTGQLEALDEWQRLRTWAMCDAETWYPSNPRQLAGSEPPAQQVRSLAVAADAIPVVPLAVLRRRAIENYLPMEALDEWLDHHAQSADEQATVNAIKDLDAYRGARFNLRHYYHLERGFGAASDDIPLDYAPFRAESALQTGLGRGVKKIYRTQLDARLTPAHWLRDAWFASDGHGTEFTDIIHSIMRRV